MKGATAFQLWYHLYQADCPWHGSPGPPRAPRLYYACQGGLAGAARDLMTVGADALRPVFPNPPDLFYYVFNKHLFSRTTLEITQRQPELLQLRYRVHFKYQPLREKKIKKSRQLLAGAR